MYDDHMQSPEHFAKEFLNRISTPSNTENEYSIELDSVKNAIMNIEQDKPAKGGKKRKFPKRMLGNANLVPIGEPQSKKEKLIWNPMLKKSIWKKVKSPQDQIAFPQSDQQQSQIQNGQPNPNTCKQTKKKRKRGQRGKKPNNRLTNQFNQPQQIFPNIYYSQYEYVPFPNVYPPRPPYPHGHGGFGYFPSFATDYWGNW